jgi:hypothetical protein
MAIYLLIFSAALFITVVAITRYAVVFPRQPFRGPLPAADAATNALAARLRTHVATLAATPRNIGTPQALENAARYIEQELIRAGAPPRLQTFDVDGVEVRNIEVVLDPPDGGPRAATIVIGAHYDSAEGTPGAHDNATGVAALLELARALGSSSPGRARLRLVFFVNEEQPYGKTPDMGSWQHARRLRDSGEAVTGMIALETIGYFSERPGSQAYPPPFGLVYGDVGNFIAFVGMPRARSFLRRALAAFRAETPFPSIGGVAPGFLEGIDLSDHWAYDRFGIPAFMVTDTAPFRNPYYHEPNDLPETVDYESLARVTAGLERMLRRIS